MSTDLIRLDLRLRRRALIGTTVGAAAYLLLVVAIYPSFKNDASLNAMVTANPGVAAAFGITGSITSPPGWLSANMYANFGPLLALLLTIGYGTAAIAGQDSDGLLGLQATLPVSRMRIVAHKSLTLLIAAAVVPAVAGAISLIGPLFQVTVDATALAGTTVALVLLAYDLGAVALLTGALTGHRGTATGVAAAVTSLAYLLSSLAPVIPGLNGIRWLSPFFWAVGDNQLSSGVGLGQLAALLALGLALTAATVPAFQRLDIH
jgi:ABC-2 type transport system permease protein